MGTRYGWPITGKYSRGIAFNLDRQNLYIAIRKILYDNSEINFKCVNAFYSKLFFRTFSASLQ